MINNMNLSADVDSPQKLRGVKRIKNYLLFFLSLFLIVSFLFIVRGNGYNNKLATMSSAPRSVVPKSDFKVFYAASYQNKDGINLAKEGFLPIYVIYEADILTKNPQHKNDRNYSEIDAGKLKIVMDSLQKIRKINPSIPVCIDIEGWQLNRGWERASIPKYVSVLNLLKPHATEIGLYNRTSYEDANKIQNVMFPSFYTRYPSIETWKGVVTNKLKVLRQGGGEDAIIYAFITPQFNHNYEKLGLADTFLPAEMWRQELEFLYNHVNGVVIWGSKRFNPDGFTKDSPWFKETLAFMQEHSLR